MILTIITFITALSISAIAIYYSVAGLMTIFAAAAIPIMIMGGVLEISKLVTAVWLHRYWNQAVWWLKTYLTLAVVVLMLITSMGIFGFLSRAHIEQTAGAAANEQVISRIEQDIFVFEEDIDRAEAEIAKAETNPSNRDEEIQSQITLEQQRIDGALARIQPDIDRQTKIIEREQELTSGTITRQLNAIEDNLARLQEALDRNDTRSAQGIVGVKQDGAMGPATRAAIEAYKSSQEAAKQPLLDELAKISSQPNETIVAAETEIKRIRANVEGQIAESNQLISRLQSQLGQDNSEEVASFIDEQRKIISTAREQIAELRDEKFEMETELRMLEAELGPIKYIAELVYGDADKELLEQSVRWVILIIIFVFDPLAVLLLIASQYSYNLHKSGVVLNRINTPEDIIDLSDGKIFDDDKPVTKESKRAVRFSNTKDKK